MADTRLDPQQMSQTTRELYDYERSYLTKASRDISFVGKVKTHLVGRALTLGVSLLLHAEAVSRAVYICFLTLRDSFSRPNRELLLQQKIECSTAYNASLQSFWAIFSQHILKNWEEPKKFSEIVKESISTVVAHLSSNPAPTTKTPIPQSSPIGSPVKRASEETHPSSGPQHLDESDASDDEGDASDLEFITPLSLEELLKEPPTPESLPRPLLDLSKLEQGMRELQQVLSTHDDFNLDSPTSNNRVVASADQPQKTKIPLIQITPTDDIATDFQTILNQTLADQQNNKPLPLDLPDDDIDGVLVMFGPPLPPRKSASPHDLSLLNTTVDSSEDPDGICVSPIRQHQLNLDGRQSSPASPELHTREFVSLRTANQLSLGATTIGRRDSNGSDSDSSWGSGNLYTSPSGDEATQPGSLV